jgi:hypothetical protein
MAVEQLSKGNDDGTNFGQSATDKIGFYGLTTPIVKPTVTFVGSSGGTVAASVSLDLSVLRTALSNLGLIVSAGP